MAFLQALTRWPSVGLMGGLCPICKSARLWFLIPFRDLWGFAVWVAGLAGSTVEWRGERLRLDREGRILFAPTD